MLIKPTKKAPEGAAGLLPYYKDRYDICPFRNVFVMRWALSIVLAVKDFPSVFKPLLQISLIAGVRAVNPFKVVGCL